MSGASALLTGWDAYGMPERAYVPQSALPEANTTFSVVTTKTADTNPYFIVEFSTQAMEMAQSEDMSHLVSVVKIAAWAGAGLLGIISVLIGVIYANLRGDFDDLKKSNIELVKSVASIDKQVAVSNQRLDDILRELQKGRR